jgi:isopropylmalate/homocitrate/citramalate synthase
LDQPWISDKWYGSWLNFVPDINGKISKDVTITDCTLRDGEQQAGIVFSKEDKVMIARKLDEVGIHQIEAGMPMVSQEDYEAVKAIVREKLHAHLYVLSRAIKTDIDMVLSCGVPGVQVSMPSGELQIKYKLKWPEEKIISTAVDIIDYAKAHGLWVNLSPYDTTRANPVFLQRYIETVVKETKVDRIRMVDTVGSARPAAIGYLTKQMKKWAGSVPLEIHCHNDFGLAVANSLAALEAGASAVSTTVNGIGERVGNASTEEVAMALLVLYGVDTKLRYEKLTELSQLVQKLSGVKVQPGKPIVGEGAFKHETGISVDGILELPWCGEGYAPELVGQTRKIVLGKKSGTSSIKYALERLGLQATNQQISQILNDVKNESIRTKDLVSEQRFEQIAKSVLAANQVSAAQS